MTYRRVLAISESMGGDTGFSFHLVLEEAVVLWRFGLQVLAYCCGLWL